MLKGWEEVRCCEVVCVEHADCPGDCGKRQVFGDVEVEMRTSTEVLTVLLWIQYLLTRGYARNNSSVAPVGRGGIPARKVGVPRKRRVRGN